MNIWKWLSIILIVLNIGFFVWLYSALSGTYDDKPEAGDSHGEAQGLQIILPNATVETFINDALRTSGSDNITVDISTEEITLHSVNQIFGASVNTVFNIEPDIESDNIIFYISNIDIGSLPLSQDALYTVITRAAELPEGVSFSEDTKALVIDPSLFEEDLPEDIQIETIDYGSDAWYFSIER